MMTESRFLARLDRSQTRRRRGLPAIRCNGFPGKRVEPQRAGIMPTALFMTTSSERSGAKSKDPVGLAFGLATGLKAWPRRLRQLRCSLDFARRDGDIMLSSPKLSPLLPAGRRPANPPCFLWCRVEVRFALGWRARLHCERTRRRSPYRRLETNGKDRFGVLAWPRRPCLARACDTWNVGREHPGRSKSPSIKPSPSWRKTSASTARYCSSVKSPRPMPLWFVMMISLNPLRFQSPQCLRYARKNLYVLRIGTVNAIFHDRAVAIDKHGGRQRVTHLRCPLGNWR